MSLIHLDIGNSVIMGASDTAKETLIQLSACGFTLALNDFGGDDINLLHILDCGFSIIHLSPSLICRLGEDPNALTLIRSIIALTQTMGIDSTAVGVETKEQERKLKEIGIDSLQGFYYSKPQSAEDFDTYLKKQSK
jgi:EAL domain-containing protein (putative c-di-GMP-specific phosphodiesterase class I)